MKKINLLYGSIVLAVFFMILPINAQADLIQSLDNVRFWALDDPIPESGDDDEIVFSNVVITTESNLEVEYTLTPTVEASWDEFITGTEIDVTQTELVYLRAIDGSFTKHYDGTLTFYGFDRNYYGLDAYNSLLVDWGIGTVTINFTTPENNDDLAPVPIPSTVWIFGAGVIGLLGIRRKLRS